MSQRRINGQGVRPYVWNDSGRNTRARSNDRMSVSARAAREAKLRKEKQRRLFKFCSFAVLFVAVGMWFALVWSQSARADRDLALAAERRQQLIETIERKQLILDNEISNRVICQVAEEKIYMQRPSAVKTVSIYLPQRAGNQTAGK